MRTSESSRDDLPSGRCSQRKSSEGTGHSGLPCPHVTTADTPQSGRCARDAERFAQPTARPGAPDWPLPRGGGRKRGQSNRVTPGDSQTLGHEGLRCTCPAPAPRAWPPTGAVGKETHFPRRVLGIRPACYGEGRERGSAIFLPNFPLGVGDRRGRLSGVAKPIFCMQSKVTLI